jgi:PAS domain S-box-containing protein
MATRLEHIKDWCARHSDDPEAKFLSSLERHARIIATDNSEIDALMRQILALPSESSIQQLFQAYELNVAKAIQRAQQYRAPLYVLSFLVVIGMVGAFWALRSANRNLEQRVHERTRDLGRSEERFRTLCVASPIGIYMADPEGELVYANPAWEKVFQLTLNESLADRWQRALHPEERDLVIAEWRSATKGGATFTREFRLLVRAKETRWVVCQAAAIPGAKGEIAGFVGTAEDITERKRVEAALEQANKQFVEVSRKAGMSEVATSVLHNVGNVLNSVNISVSTISDRLKRSKSGQLANVTAMMDQHATDLGDFITKDTKGRGLPNFLKELSGQLAEERAAILSEVTSLTKNVDHLKGIVAMQQNYAKISGVTEKVNVTDLAEDALRLNASALLRHDVHLFREYDEHLPEITVEKHKALQILVNLIRNANQACDETRSMDRHLTVCVTNGSNRVRIAIKDNGVGIRAEHLNRIFSHGFTTKKDGHGFGLHSSCLAAKEMGGALTAHSDGQDKGATFVLELPWQPEKA